MPMYLSPTGAGHGGDDHLGAAYGHALQGGDQGVVWTKKGQGMAIASGGRAYNGQGLIGWGGVIKQAWLVGIW